MNSRGFTQDKMKGQYVSVRIVQAMCESMVQFILARYKLWTSPTADKYMVLYDSSKTVAYTPVVFDYSSTALNDSLDSNGFGEVIQSICIAALSNSKVQRQTYKSSAYSSCSSSSCSSSCSSSSSSSCSSSSCSSSCSTTFIAYLKII